MLWSDNEEFQQLNTPHLVNWNMYMYKYTSWSDNEAFQQLNTSADEKPGYRNANMLWSDNEEFQRVNTRQAAPSSRP